MNRQGLFFFLLLFFSRLAAQSLAESGFAHYTTASGLSDNNITAIAQDATGYIWIATLSGLNRFDGREFVQFHSNGDSLSLASETINGMTWLNKNELAVYNTGLHIINTKTGERHNLFIPYYRKQLQYKFNMIARVMGDEAGNIYVLTRSGFYHFDSAYKLVSRFDYYSEADIPVTHFVFGGQLLQLDKHRLLIVSVNGLYVYDKTEKKVKKMKVADCPLLAAFFNYPSDECVFLQLKPGHFFILKGASDSLVYVNIIENKKVVSRMPVKPILNEFRYRTRLMPVNDTLFYLTGHFSGFYKLHFNPESGAAKLDSEKYFQSFQCNALLKDKDNHLWVATNKGLFRQDPGRAQVQTAEIPPSLEDSFPDIIASEVFATANNVYVGTRNFGNLLLYDKSSFRFIRKLDFESYRKKTLQSLNIFSIVEADTATLLLATDGPLFLVNKKITKSTVLRPPGWGAGDWSADLYKQRNGTIWISSYHVYTYNHSRGTFSFIPEAVQLTSQILQPEVIRDDASGNIWMAGHGLSRYNTLLQRFDRRLDSFPFIKMPDKQVSAMVIDTARNTIWFSSQNNGLLSYNISKGSFQQFTTNDGLPDNNIAALTIVGNELWIAAAARGIACMNLDNFRMTGFGKEDGFPEMPMMRRGNFFYDGTSQQLYLAFAKAIVRFHPDGLLRKKTPPHLFIEGVTISDQKPVFLPEQNITTSWKANQIRLTIGTINFSDAGNQRFAYRILKNASTPWTDMGNQPSFSISNLAPGTHQIQVKVYSVTNRWPEQVKEISIIVLPPLWLKSWFLALTGLLLLTLLYVFIKWRTRQARQKEMEKTHIEKLKADHYKSQFELEQITNYFSSSLAGKKTEEEVLWDVTSNLMGRMNYEDCIIYLWNEAKTKMVQKAAYGPKGAPEIISTNVFEVLPGQGIVGYVVQTKQPLLVNDTRKDSRYRVDDQFRLSEVAVPIVHNDELLGVLDSENSTLNYFSERDVKILTTIATLLANKLKQIESEQSLEAKQQELAGINEQLAEARLSALQAQMNPHFVFNALNSIKRMILDGDNEMASRYLSKFALMIRMTLEHSKEIFVTLDENIEYLKAYLDMEQLRFGDSFSYSIHTDKHIDVDETVIPSLMIQPLVENAIWHGLMQAEREKKLWITFSQAKSKIICTVEDNGIGIRRSEKLREKQRPLHHSVGLQNLQKRIRIMNEKYNTACSLDLMDLADGNGNSSGTKAVLQLNLLTTYQKS